MRKLTFAEQTFWELPQSMAIKQADDAWHPHKTPIYIEWWYFDVMNTDGSIIRGQFTITGNLDRTKTIKVAVRATYINSNGAEIAMEEWFPYSAFSASTESCDVKIGNNFIKGNIAHSELHMESGDKSLDLTFDSAVPGFTSYASFGDEKKYMYWVVPQPRGNAKGAFKTGGKTIDISGVGYRDHNWINFSSIGSIAYWDWGRISDKEYTIIFADIVTAKALGAARAKPLLIFDKSRLVYMTSVCDNWAIIKEDKKFDAESGLTIPWRHYIKARDENLSLDIDLKMNMIFQRLDPLAEVSPWLRWYIRTFKAKPSIASLLSTGQGKLSISGKEKELNCTTVHEFVNNS